MKRSSGITLIELLIVVAIVGILAAVAAPSYREYVLKGEYSSAQQALMGLAQAMEQYYAQNITYRGVVDGNKTNDDSGTPTIYTAWAPADGPSTAKKYDLTVVSGSGTYTLTATSTSDSGHWFKYTNTGVKSWRYESGGSYTTKTGCWNKRDC